MGPRRGGPRSDVLARLAEGMPGDDLHRTPSVRARLAGLLLCALTAAMVLVAIITAGSP